MRTLRKSVYKVQQLGSVAIVFAVSIALSGCSAGSNGGAIDAIFGALSDSPILSAVPIQVLQQTQELSVDVSNVKETSTGSDKDMSYSCRWKQVTGAPATAYADCLTLPNGSGTFNTASGLLKWTPSTSELGQFQFEITGTNKAGSDRREFTADVRLSFNGLESLTQVQGDRMTLNWTPNPDATGYQIFRKNADGTLTFFQAVTDPSLGSITLLNLVPLTTYAFRIVAIDRLGAVDGNTVTLSAVTADLIRLEVTSAASELSPGQSTTVTVRLKDNGGNYLSTSGLSVGFAMSGSGTGSGTFGPTSDLGNGIYTAVFTATTPGTANPITASLSQFYYVEQTAAMTVRPLQIEILASAAKVNPNRAVTLTARIRDFTGALVSTGGHALAFTYSNGTSVATITPATDLGTGTYTATLLGDTAGTAITLGATLSTTATIYSTTTVQVVPYSIEITSALSDVSVTRSTTVTAKVKDWQGTYVTSGGQGLTFQIQGSAGIVTLGSTTDANNGTYSATITGLSLGTIVVSASMTPSHTVTQTAAVTVRKLRLEIASSLARLMPTQTATLTGKVKDWQGNVIGVGGQSFDFSASAGTSSGTIGTVTDLGTGIYTATFTAGTAGTALTISGSISETYQVDVSGSITVEKWRVYVTTAASSVPTGQSVVATVTVKDYLDVKAPAGGQTVSISLSGGTSSGSVSSVIDNNNGTYSASLTGITSGSAMTVTAALTQSYQVIQTASLSVGAIHLAVTVQNAKMNPAGTSYVYAQVKDSSGSNLTGGSYTINFSYSGGTSTGSFSAVSNLGNGLYRALFTGTVGGTPITIVAASATTTFVVDSTQTLEVVPWSLKITAPSSSVTVGQSVALTGRVYNYLNQPVASGGQGFAMSLATTGIGSLSSVTDNNDGSYSATFTASGVGSSSVAGNVTSSYSLDSTVTFTTTALHLAVTVQNAQMNPGGASYVYAQLKDAAGTNLTLGSYSINFAVTGGTSTGTFSAVTNQGGGLYRATFSGATGGTPVTITAASATTAYVVDSTQSIEVVPWSLKITSPSTAVTLGQSVTLTGRVYDFTGALVTSGGKGFAMTLATSGPGSLSAVVDNNDGTYTTTFTATNSGSTVINGSLSTSFTLSSTVTLVTSDLHLVVTVQNAKVNPSGASFVYVQTKNAAGANISGGSYSLTFSHVGGTSTGSFGSVTSLGSGLYRATFTAATGGTPTTITASSATAAFVVDSTQTIEVVPWSLKITSSSTDVTVGQTATLTGRVYDYNGVALASGGKTFTMALADTDVGSLSAVTDNNNGVYTAVFTATGSGTSAVSGSIASSFTLDSTVTLTVSDVHLAVTVQNAQLNPGGASYVYVQTKNAAGVNISGGNYSLAFAYSGGTSTGSFSAVTSLGSGLYRATFTGASGGTPITISASSATQPFVVDSTQTIEVVPWSLKITASSSTIIVGQSATLTGRVYDYLGNLVTTGGKGFAMSLVTSGVGALSAVTDNNDGTYTASFTAGAVGSTSVGASISGSYALTSTVTLTTGAVHLAITVQNSQMNPGGTSFVYIQTKDGAGNPISGGNYSLSFANTGGTSTGSFSAITSLGSGQYRATFTGATGGTATTISASSATYAFVVDSTQTITVVPWSLKITASSTAVTVGQSVSVTGKVYDWTGAQVTTGGKGFAMGLATTGVGALSPVNDAGDGSYTTSFTATGVGSTSITGNISSSYTVTSTVTLVSTAVHLSLSVTQSYLNPGEGVVVTALVKDAAGNNLMSSGYTIGFTYSGGSSTGSLSSTINLGTGAYTSTFVGNIAGTATTITANASVPFVVDQTVDLTVMPWRIYLAATATNYAINETGTITGTVRNWNNVVVTTGGKGISLALGASGIGAISSTTDNTDGTYAANFQATGVGTVQVTANMAQSFTVNTTLNLVVGKIYLTATLGPSNLASGNLASGSTLVARVTIRNSSGTTVTGTGYSINLAATGGSSTVSADTALSEVSTGVYEMTYRGVTSGTALTLTPSATVPYVTSATAALTVIPSSTISSSNSTLVTSSTTVRSGSTVTLTATLKDAAGNLVSGLTNVTFAKSTGAGIGSGTFSSVSDTGNGTYSATFTGSSQGANPTTITVSSGGVTVATSVNVTVTSGSPSSLTLSGPTAATGGTCSAPFYLSFFDGAGNPTTLASSASFTVSGLGYGNLYSDSGCSTAVTTIDVNSGASGSNMFYLKTYYPGTYTLTFSTSGITQSNTVNTLVTPVLSWIGAAGTLDAYGTGNVYGLGFFDGSFQQAQAMSLYNDGTSNFLMVSDYANHSIQKINVTNLSSISVVGALGRVNFPKGAPTGGTNSSYCTGISSSAGVNGAYCTGGQYTTGNGDGQLNSPYKSTVMTIASVRYLFVADTNNNRVVKYKADTGEFVGWTGYTTTATTSCLNGTATTTNTPANSATTGFCLGGSPTNPPTAYVTGSTVGGNAFRNPTVIANDGTYLYVYDSGNTRMVMLDPSSGQLVRWMGRLASSAVGGISGTTNSLTCLSNQSDNSAPTDGYFTPSWCTGGYAIGTTLAQGSSANIYLNPQWTTLRGIGFYSDGTYNWMAVVDSSTSRVIRYFCGAATATPNCNSTSLVSITSGSSTAAHGPGEYFGWTGWVGGTAANSGGSLPASINSTSFFQTTAAGNTFTASNGWAYYGTSSGQNAQGATNNSNGLLINGSQLYTASVNSNRVDRLNLLTGVYNGWIGRISSTPSGGVSGCAGANAGSITPGWCLGGSATTGSAPGAFGIPIDVVTDGTYLFISDRDNFRISINNLSTGAVIGEIGLRLNNQPTAWSTTPYAVGTVMPTSTGLKDWNTQRDRVFNYPDQAVIQGNYMYVSDTSSHRIKRYKWLDGSFAGWVGLTNSLSPTGGDEACVGAIVGGFTPGWCQGGGFTNTSAFGFNNPRGLASDGTYLYVADTSNHRIVRLSLLDGSFSGWIGYIGTAPSDGDPGCSSVTAGNVTPGWCLGGAGTSTNAFQLGGFSAPWGLVGFTDTDNKYYLIVADRDNHRLQKIEAANPTNVTFVGFTTTAVSACSTAASSVTAQWCNQSGVATSTGTTASPGYANNGSLNAPRGLAIDTSTSPYYVYTTNSTGRVQRFNATTGAFGGFVGMINTVGTTPGCLSGSQAASTVTPSWCTGGVTSAATSSSTIGQLSNTMNGLYSDGTYLYVSDTASHRIQRWTRSTGVFGGWVGRVLTAPTAGGSACTSLTNGSITPTWCTGGTPKAGYLFDTTNMKSAFDTPTGIVGMGSYLYILDSVNGRVISMPKN